MSNARRKDDLSQAQRLIEVNGHGDLGEILHVRWEHTRTHTLPMLFFSTVQMDSLTRGLNGILVRRVI